MSVVIEIEDDDHKVEHWQGADGIPYIYVEDLVKRAGVARLLFNFSGQLIYRELPEEFGGNDSDPTTFPVVYWERVSAYID